MRAKKLMPLLTRSSNNGATRANPKIHFSYSIVLNY